MNILIKLMSIVSLVIAPTLANVYHTKDHSGTHAGIIKENTKEITMRNEVFRNNNLFTTVFLKSKKYQQQVL